MMVSVVCLYVLLYEDQLSDDPVWFVHVVTIFILKDRSDAHPKEWIILKGAGMD